MSAVQFEEVIALALQLSPAEQARLMEQLAISVHEALTETADVVEPVWTPEELVSMMQIEPMTGSEIVASGLTGVWSDLGITDGSEWVNKRKQQRKDQTRW